MNLDPIRPYLSLIKLGIGATLICGAFVAGCNHGEDNKQEQVVTLTEQVNTLTLANEEWAAKTEEANKQVEANRRFAEEQMKLAEQAGERLSEQREKTRDTIASLEKQLADAKRIPVCQAQLGQQLCSAVPVYSLP